ncbi:MAG: patatin-like phospholipase family protein, partial [Acidobacteriaceae bacterium]
MSKQHYPSSVCQVLAEEALTMTTAQPASSLNLAGPEAGAADEAGRVAALATLALVRAKAEEAKGAPDSAEDLAATLSALGQLKRSALCFSGGGIRSATFGLGVLQGLAQLSRNSDGALRSFDFISTVSGGGYLGGWLSRWRVAHPRGMEGVVDDLRAEPRERLDPEPPQVAHLRA